MSTQDIVQLPHQHIAHLEGEDLKAAIERNFKEVAHMLYILQIYEKKVGKPINAIVDFVTDESGNLLTSKLNEKMVGLANELKLADEAVTAAKLAVAAVIAEKIAEGAVVADKIAANAITAVKIAAGAITADKLNVSELSAITAYLGTVIGGSIYGTLIRTGLPEATHTYIELTPEGNLVFMGATGTKTLEMRAGWGQGDVRWYDQYENLAGSILIKPPAEQAFWIKSNRSDTDIYIDSAKNILLAAASGKTIIAKNHLNPNSDDTQGLGDSNLRWSYLYVRWLSEGDACFAERECAVCGESFAAGDSVILLAHTIHPVLGTMTIPIHERCKDTPATFEWEVPEVEEGYSLNDLGEPEKRMVMAERDVTQPMVQIRSGYKLDQRTGQFRHEDGKPASAAEATETTLVKFRKKKMRKIKLQIN